MLWPSEAFEGDKGGDYEKRVATMYSTTIMSIGSREEATQGLLGLELSLAAAKPRLEWMQ